MEAARAGMFGCVRLLVDAGANLDSKDVRYFPDACGMMKGLTHFFFFIKREGHTAEALARIAGHREIEDFLRERAESVRNLINTIILLLKSNLNTIAGFSKRSSSTY
jgi:hypothetical protein